jgi:hypothetical protein
MKVSNFSSWIILAAAASTTAFAPRTVLSATSTNSVLLNNKNTCSAKDGSCASALSSRGGASSLSLSTTAEDNDVDTAAKKPTEIFRLDYKPLDLIVSKINMDFNIRDGKTIVESELYIEKNPKLLEDEWDPDASHDLVLDGDETSVTLLEVTLDGRVLKEDNGDYTLDSTKLIIKNPPSGSLLKTKVSIVPEDNTQLSGLYQSGPMYCTQCEAMGFRRITYYPDRPDNVS